MNHLHYVEDQNLTHAWGKAFLEVLNSPSKEVSPIMVVIAGFNSNEPIEDSILRRRLDDSLIQFGKSSCETVAGTIFPKSMWNPDLNREELFTRYEKIWERVKKNSANKYGTYFRRLTAFRGDGTNTVNQLDHIINTYVDKQNHRRSALQASIFDPALDHTNQKQRGFPCLQQLIFSPENNHQTLSVTGIYAVQNMFEKAYGNYLGLCRLGRFMAHEMGLTLTRVNCIASVAKLGNKQHGELNKNDVRDLADILKQSVEIATPNQTTTG